MKKVTSGFTIVELLIVIVVIAILATITVVAYNGIQARARDAKRDSDIAYITKILELYYIDNGEYPAANNPSAVGINGWSSTADTTSWQTVATLVNKYAPNGLPEDPKKETGATSYYSSNYSITTYYCTRQTYVIVYKPETSGGSIKGDRGGCTALPTSWNAGYNVIIKSKV